MHRSVLSQLVIDCHSDDMPAAVSFWAAALGLAPSPDDAPDDRYFALRGESGLRLLLQRVEWPSTYHVDIETDDVDAEVARLEALGATRIVKRHTWWVMRTPTGHELCVIRPQSNDGELGPRAHTWR